MSGPPLFPQSSVKGLCLALMVFMCTAGFSYASTTLTLDQAVHFLNAEGSDVVVKPGTYQLEATEQWLRLIPGEWRDALLVEARTQPHEESVTEPTAVADPTNPGQKRYLMWSGT
ncbi:MAG: hypothetical protein R3B74_12275 [Nitrospirales bacterium]|nr:hypothetical protein [Nitrospirales bacterium]